MADDANKQYGPVDSVPLNDIDQPNKKQGYRMIIITVVVILIAIGGIMISRNENLQQTIKRTLQGDKSGGTTSTGQPIPMLEVSSIESRDRAWLEVIPEKTTYSQNENVKLAINGFSEGHDITGYDILVTLDSEMFDLVGVSTEIPGFTVFPFNNGQYIAITAIKDIGENEPSVFDNTKMLTIELKPKKKGQGIISVAVSNDKEKTQLVDTNVQVLVPQIQSATVQIQ